MSEAIIVALITGGLSLAGVVVTCLATAKKSERAAAVAQAITDTKIDELMAQNRGELDIILRKECRWWKSRSK